MSDKTTITKKMTLKDYIILAWTFEHPGEEMVDLSCYEARDLAVQDKRSMRLTDKQKEYFNDYFNKFVVVGGIDTLIGGLKKTPQPKTEPKVQVIYQQTQQAPAVEIPRVDSVVASTNKLGGEAEEHPRPDNYVCPDSSFYVDPTLPLSELNKPDNIDLNIIIDLVFDGVLCEDDFWYQFGQEYYKIRQAHPSTFVFDTTGLSPAFTIMNYFVDIFDAIENKKRRINSIMNQADPTDEERFDRYKQHIKVKHGLIPKNKVLEEWAAIIESVEDISGNKIVIEEQTGKICEYDNADDMELDLIWLSKGGSIQDDTIYDVFGKKVSVDKIIKKIQRKYPDGLDKDSKLYYSEKEAYLDGALVV
jgi:hypothetical protein